MTSIGSFIINTFIGAWTRPGATMQKLHDEGDVSLKPYMVFIIVMGFISGLITAISGLIQPATTGPAWANWLAVVVVPLISFIGSFIGAFIIWWLVDGVLKGVASEYRAAYRTLAILAAFSPVSAALAPIPTVGQWLAVAVNLWATIVMIRGIVTVRETPPVRTWVTCILLFGFLFALGMIARFSAQQQAQNFGGPAFSDLNLDDDALGGSGDQLNDRLQDLANEAGKAPAASPSTQQK